MKAGKCGTDSWPTKATNANQDFSTEKPCLEVPDIRCFPLPEKAGQVILVENNAVVPDVLTDTSKLVSFWGYGEQLWEFTRDRPSCMKAGRAARRKRRR